MRIEVRWRIGPRRQGQAKTGLARMLRQNITDAERKLWWALRGRRFSGFKFRRQVPFGPYVLDFYCASQRLVIELDGGQHYFGKGKDKDAQRDSYLQKHGLTVLRYSNRDILLNREVIAEDILGKIREAPHPLSLSDEERGDGHKGNPSPSP